MKKTNLWIMGVAVTALFAGMAMILSESGSGRSWARSERPDFYGTVVEVEGSPKARRPDGAQYGLSKDVRVDEGHTVVTGPEDFTVLLLSTGDQVVITEKSELTVARDQEDADIVSLFQESGFVWSNAKKSGAGKNRFEVRTPTAVAGIRGTSFSVQVDPHTGEAGFCVCKGEIEVESEGMSGRVKSGEYLSVMKDSKMMEPFGDVVLLKYPSKKTMACLRCHQGGGRRDGQY